MTPPYMGSVQRGICRVTTLLNQCCADCRHIWLTWEFESSGLMVVSVPDQGSIDSFSTVHTGYFGSFPDTALCHEHASALSVCWCIHDNNSFVRRY